MGNRRASTAASAGDAELFTLPSPAAAKRAAGRHERAVLRAVRHPGARLAGPEHAATRAALRALATALDAAERKDDPYATAQLARPFRDLLMDSGLLGGGGDDDSGAGALLELGRATMGDA